MLAGTSSTIATHQPAEATRASPAATSCSSRRRGGVGAASRYTSANAGTTSSACSILARNAKPTKAAASSGQRVLARSSARTVAQAPATSSSTSSASGLLKRNISVATGVRASTAPASSPAAGPDQRRTAAYSTPTAATPSSAWGTRMLQELSPNRRTDRSMIHSEAGGLSQVIGFGAFQET